jgi:hypothetical protein
VVEAELRLKRGADGDKAAAKKLFERAYSDTMADPYFRGRAIVGCAEMALYDPGKKDVNKVIQLCHDAIDLLAEKPDDYFAIKAKLLQGEFINRRMAHYDKSRATGIYMGIIGNKNADIDLVARAKLDLAEISEKKKSLKLIKEVLAVKNLDAYLVKRAKEMQKTIRKIKG